MHGGAGGADQLANAIARSWGWTPERRSADWTRDGRAAGYRRNVAIVALGANVCLAFIFDGSAGTSHTAALAEAPVSLPAASSASVPASGVSDDLSVTTAATTIACAGGWGCLSAILR